MNQSKHTPGPWGLSDETTRDGLRSKLLHGAPEGMLAIIRVEHQGRYYGDANARLIAAAPKLKEALAAMLDFWGGYECPEVDAAIAVMQDIGEDRWSMQARMEAEAEARTLPLNAEGGDK